MASSDIVKITKKKGYKLIQGFNWDITPKEITNQTNALINELTQGIEEIEALDESDRDFENVVYQFDLLLGKANDKLANIYFPSFSSTNKEVRDISNQESARVYNFFIDVMMRPKLYQAMKSVKSKNLQLDKLQTRLLDKYLKDFTRNGLDLPEETQEEIKGLKQKLSDLGVKFGQNLNENSDFVIISKEEVGGVPESAIKTWEKMDDSSYKVNVTAPNYEAIMDYAKNADLRKKFDDAWNLRCMDSNIPILEEAIATRNKIAQLLGYKNHADYVLEIKMAQDAETVKNFLNDLIHKFQPLADKQFEKLIGLKQEEEGEQAGSIKYYDWRYYTRKLNEKTFDIKMKQVQEYLPMDHVIKSMLEFYQDIFGYTFIKLDEADAWHQDVECYGVYDNAKNRFQGVFYLDFYPREGKFGHAAVFPLYSGRKFVDGSRNYPVNAMLANFNKPSPDSPALATWDQVETLFHEFGHIIHFIAINGSYYKFAGSDFARDFIEAPSQMLENWVYEPEIIQKFTNHYQTNEILPNELQTKLAKLRTYMKALFWLRQLFFGVFDITLHTVEEPDIAKIWKTNFKEILKLEPASDIVGAGAFGHLLSGYDAGYYGYLWALVIAQDLYTRFEEEGSTSKAVGLQYRQLILEPGNDLDEIDLVKNFLNREPNNNAFLKLMGLE